jgi:hypothetical protein
MRISITPSMGEAPKITPGSLPENYAQTAENTDLGRLDVRGWRAPGRVAALDGTTLQTIFQWLASGDTHWAESANDVDHIKSPLASDTYERAYLTGESEPRVLANDLVSEPFDYSMDFYKLGVPTPTAPITIGTYTGSGAVYRSYVYTFITAYGEEGPPCVSSFPSISDYLSGTVEINSIESAPASRRIESLYLYRTNSDGAGAAEFQFVLEATWFDADTDYAVGDFVIYSGSLYKCTTIHPNAAWNSAHFTAGDDVADADLAEVLPSLNYKPPPAGLKGLISLANGVCVGFINNEIRFSEPYLPHAWPPGYAVAFPVDIVGIAGRGSSVFVMTNGNPYLVSGTDPGFTSKTELAGNYPCTDKRGIAAGEKGIYYPSGVGLILVDENGAVNVTPEIMTPDDWAEYSPSDMLGTIYNGMYVGFYGNRAGGIVLDFVNRCFSRLSIFAHARHLSTGGVLYLCMDDGYDEANPPASVPLCVKQWGSDTYNFLSYTWKSKRYLLSSKKNFAAARVYIDSDYYAEVVALVAQNSYLVSQNATLFADDLGGAINDTTINVYSVNGDVLLDLAQLSISPTVVFKLYADNVLKFTKLLTNLKPFKLPRGFKARRLEVEVAGYIPVTKINIASSMREIS